MHDTTNFKATALNEDSLHAAAPSIFASGPMAGVSGRYTFVPTARIISGLRDLDWVPVAVEEQRIRSEARRGFQKHLLRGIDSKVTVNTGLWRLAERVAKGEPLADAESVELTA